MTRDVAAMLVAGVLFGFGLTVSGMTEADKVVHFLDVTGTWDASLAFVMGGAIGVHFVAYRLVPRMASPWFATTFQIPTRRDLDARLVAGSALFGVGWSLGGFCPGPAITSLVALQPKVLVFVAAMFVGMLLFQAWDALQKRRAAAATAARGPAASATA
jgi:hypothetical protein